MSGPQGTNQFTADEYVLAYHGPLLYEARILLAENWNESTTLLGSTGPHYFIHYKGWKQTWDEWVPEQRILKLNDQSFALRRKLLEAQTRKKLPPAPTSAAAPPTPSATATPSNGANGKGKDKAPAGGKKAEPVNVAAGKKRGRESVVDHVSGDAQDEQQPIENGENEKTAGEREESKAKSVKKGKKDTVPPKAKKARESVSAKASKLEEERKEREAKASEGKKGRAARAAARLEKADAEE